MAGKSRAPRPHYSSDEITNIVSTEDRRRSGRATKGQHKRGREDGDSAPKKGQAKGKKTKAEPEPEEEEEEDEIIRCVCGKYEEEEDNPRTMICCDKCAAWQHNDCMGLPEDYAPDKYFCEQCKPSDHKKLVAAMKRGEKPWEEVARRREAAEAEKAAKKKGKKGRKSAGPQLNESQRTPTLEPEEVNSKKRKLDESPAQETKVRVAKVCESTELIHWQSKRARSSARESVVQEPVVEDQPMEADGDANVTANDNADEVKAEDTQQDSDQVTDETTANIPNPALDGAAEKVEDIQDNFRKKVASNIAKSFIEQAESLAKSGAVKLMDGQNAETLGTKVALQVEHALYYVVSGGVGDPNEAYKLQMRAILNNIKTNTELAANLINQTLPADKLAAMDPKDMATEEQKQKDAEEKQRMEKQHVLVEEQGPRIRKTHKGDEYVDEPLNAAPSAPTAPPAPVRTPSTMDKNSEMKSPQGTNAGDKTMRKPSATGKGRPFGDSRRKSSSSNFDINKVWSGVQGSPTEGDAPKFPEVSQRASPPRAVDANAGNDPEIDNLLKDEDNESEPYSPKDFSEEGVVWKGKVIGGSLGTFNTVAKFAAGCQPDVENLRLTWSEVIPAEIKLHGRIQPSKADDYLCGLEYSNTTELVIVNILEPKEPQEQAQFTKFFNYLKQKDRYGVGMQHSVPAIKDIYLLPMEAGQALPTVMRALEHELPDPVQERSFLVPIVIKWTELPHNAERVRQQQQQIAASTMSPSVGPPVIQTPITPHESQPMFFDSQPPNQPQMGQAVNGGFQSAQQTPTVPTQLSTPPPQPQQQSQASTAQQPTQAPVPSQQSPAATHALQILGPEMSQLPAVVNLIAQAPRAGESEFIIIKECIEENAEAGRSLGVLTQMLQQKYQNQRAGDGTANQTPNQNQNQAQAPVAAQ